MKIPMYSPEGKPVADLEIPDDVIEAAHKVANYLGKNTGIASLCGLYIKIGTVSVELRI